MKKILLSSALNLLLVSSIGVNTISAQSVQETPANIEIVNTSGVLELIETPAAFTVVEGAVSTGESTLTPQETLSITMSDFRPVANGWTLSAELGGFTLVDNPSVDTLLNTTIGFSNLVAETLNPAVDATAPTLFPITLAAGGASDIIASANRTEVADVNAGVGPWGITGDTLITIPAFSSSVGSHTATITWTLADAY